MLLLTNEALTKGYENLVNDCTPGTVLTFDRVAKLTKSTGIMKKQAQHANTLEARIAKVLAMRSECHVCRDLKFAKATLRGG